MMTIREMFRAYLRNKLENWGIFQPKLIAKICIPVEWDIDYDGDEVDEYVEVITFFLLEHASGRRCFDIDIYGMCEETERYKPFLADITEWVHGGKLPKDAHLSNTSATILDMKDGKKTT